jgi:hypothetical protein
LPISDRENTAMCSLTGAWFVHVVQAEFHVDRIAATIWLGSTGKIGTRCEIDYSVG